MSRAMDDDKARGKREMKLMFQIVDQTDYALFKKHLYFLSRPHYVKVLQLLLLKPGMSFLNIGSETGYFNTVAGLALGRYGTNHGVELYRHFVQFAYTQLEKFMQSPAMDVFDFCEPVFVQGDA